MRVVVSLPTSLCFLSSLIKYYLLKIILYENQKIKVIKIIYDMIHTKKYNSIYKHL